MRRIYDGRPLLVVDPESYADAELLADTLTGVEPGDMQTRLRDLVEQPPAGCGVSLQAEEGSGVWLMCEAHGAVARLGTAPTVAVAAYAAAAHAEAHTEPPGTTPGG